MRDATIRSAGRGDVACRLREYVPLPRGVLSPAHPPQLGWIEVGDDSAKLPARCPRDRFDLLQHHPYAPDSRAEPVDDRARVRIAEPLRRDVPDAKDVERFLDHLSLTNGELRLENGVQPPHRPAVRGVQHVVAPALHVLERREGAPTAARPVWQPGAAIPHPITDQWHVRVEEP